jgi:hypothetical protein
MGLIRGDKKSTNLHILLLLAPFAGESLPDGPIEGQVPVIHGLVS